MEASTSLPGLINSAYTHGLRASAWTVIATEQLIPFRERVPCGACRICALRKLRKSRMNRNTLSYLATHQRPVVFYGGSGKPSPSTPCQLSPSSTHYLASMLILIYSYFCSFSSSSFLTFLLLFFPPLTPFFFSLGLRLITVNIMGKC